MESRQPKDLCQQGLMDVWTTYFLTLMSHDRGQYITNHFHQCGNRRNQSVDDGIRGHVKQSKPRLLMKDDSWKKQGKIFRMSIYLFGSLV